MPSLTLSETTSFMLNIDCQPDRLQETLLDMSVRSFQTVLIEMGILI